MDVVRGEPAQREGRRIGPPDDDRARLAEIRDDGAILRRAVIGLELEAVGGREAPLVRVHLDGDGHAGQQPGGLAARDSLVHRIGGGQRLLRHRLDHGIEPGVHRIESRQRGERHLAGRDLAGPDAARDLARIQPPEIGHQIGHRGFLPSIS
jgi:hypothetical protein